MAFAARLDAAPPAPEPTIARPSDATANSRPSLDERIDGLLYTAHWSGRSITYSDPDRAGDYEADYWADGDGDGVSAQHEGFARFTPEQMATVHAILNTRVYSQPAGHAGFSVEGFTNLDIAYAGAGAGDGILRFANSGDATPTAYAYFPPEGDAWFDQSGYMCVSTAPAFDDVGLGAVEAAAALGAPERVFALSEAETRARCNSPRFRGAVRIPDFATLQPARLALGLRRRLIERGVKVYEHSPVRRVGPPVETGAPGSPTGLLRTVCHVPGNLLNDGRYRVALTIVRDNVPVVREPDALVFDIQDSVEDRDGWYDKWPGARVESMHTSYSPSRRLFRTLSARQNPQDSL